MSRQNELLAFYGQVLHGLNCNVTDDSLVQMVTANQTIPVTLEKPPLRLALPTAETLNKLAEGNLVAFHPMCENIILGQSPVISLLRSLTIESLSLKIMATIIGITMAIADKTELSATQIKFASDFDKVDEKTVKALVKLADAIDPTTENRLINVYLKHGGMIGDEQFKRIATVTFPLYGALLEATDTVYGVKMRKQDVRMLILMLEKLFPNIGEKDTYSYGSSSLVCPYFHSLLNAFGNVVGQLNKRTFIFRKIIEDYTGETPHVNIDYIENFADGRPFKDILPPLDYNQGTEVSGQSAKAAPAEYQPPVQPQQQQQQQPIDLQPLNREYVEQVTQQAPPPVPQAPQYPVPGPGYATAPPTPTRRYEGSKIKSIGASAASDSDTPATQRPSASNGTSPADLAAMMYPPEIFPQMQPQQMMQPQYPQFGPGAVQPQMQPQQLYPNAQYAPQPQYQQPVQMQPQGYPQQQGYPQYQQPMQPQYQQPMNQYGQPVYQQQPPQRSNGYPVFGGQQQNGGIQNPNAGYQQR